MFGLKKKQEQEVEPMEDTEVMESTEYEEIYVNEKEPIQADVVQEKKEEPVKEEPVKEEQEVPLVEDIKRLEDMKYVSENRFNYFSADDFINKENYVHNNLLVGILIEIKELREEIRKLAE